MKKSVIDINLLSLVNIAIVLAWTTPDGKIKPTP